jgi:hypothetical protein
MCSAVVKGLVENSTLKRYTRPIRKFQLFSMDLYGKRCSRATDVLKASLTYCSISLEAFECLTRGLSNNTSLESLELSYTKMTDDCQVSLVDGLRTNKSLKYLDLSENLKSVWEGCN